MAAATALGGALFSLGLALLFKIGLRVPDERVAARATLVMPATGRLPGLEELFSALVGQTQRPARLLVAVESREDPAYDRVASLAEGYPDLNIGLAVAGISPLRSQKCTNLLAGLSRIDGDAEYVVLLDADIRPQPWWLAALLAPLASGEAEVVSGYRWPVAERLGVATALVAAVDRAVALLPRLSWARAIWGGSLALSRRALDRLALPVTIGRALSDDLAIGDRIADIGLPAASPRALRAVPTPIDGGFGELWRFGRRQYQIIRVYRPLLWTYAALMVSAELLARCLLLAAILGSLSRFAAATLFGVALLGSVVVELRCAIGKKLAAADAFGFRLAQHGLAWMLLAVPAFHASLIWSSLFPSAIDWGHVRYFIDAKGRVTATARRNHASIS